MRTAFLVSIGAASVVFGLNMIHPGLVLVLIGVLAIACAIAKDCIGK